MNRRDLIALLGSTAVVWPVGAGAQQPERMRRIGALMGIAPDDPEGHARIAAFVEKLHELGWSEGRNLRIEVRWGVADAERIRQNAAELVALAPDIILANTSLAVLALRNASRTLPIVFVTVIDPVGQGFVDSLARPGGNTTGFTLSEYGIAGKWLELLKEVATVRRVAVLRDPTSALGGGQLGSIQAVAHSLGVELNPISERDAGEIERGIMSFAQSSKGGLIVTASATTAVYRDLIIGLAARHHLPAIYPFRFHALSGGLMSYGPDPIDQFRRAAVYIDRILKGDKPADLPVQAPTRYELVINLKTAKALGLDVPATLLATADEVIE
jgi:putative tryptophan/tyrosine transport system substrate-binding protein